MVRNQGMRQMKMTRMRIAAALAMAAGAAALVVAHVAPVRGAYGPTKTITLTVYPAPSSPLVVCLGTKLEVKATLSGGEYEGVDVYFYVRPKRKKKKKWEQFKSPKEAKDGVAKVIFETDPPTAASAGIPGRIEFQARAERKWGYRRRSNIVEVTVLWVVLDIRKDQGDSFSADNSSTSKPWPALLGVRQIGPQAGAAPTFGYVVEIVGEVTPSDFDQNIVLERDVVDDFSAQETPAGAVTITFDQDDIDPGVDGGNDTSPDEFRDDDPRANGRVYDIDAPGIRTDDPFGEDSPPDTIIYRRGNFIQYATFGGVRCSDDFEWFYRVTGIKTGAVGTGTWARHDRAGHPDDNDAGEGTTTTAQN